MLRSLLLLMVGCLLGAMAKGVAMIALLPDQEMIGSSDLVIVGTVLEDQRVDGLPGRADGRSVVRIDRVLKGDAKGTIVVWHAMPPQPPPGVIISDHGGFELQPQTQWIFFLQRYQGGYTLTGGITGRRQVGLEDRYAEMIKAFPVQLTLNAPIAPFYFGQEVPVTVTVKNMGVEPVKCYQPSLEGLYYSPRFGTNLTFRPIVKRADMVGAVQLEPVTVEPNGTKTMALSFVTTALASWQVFTPDTYLITPIFVRARVFVEAGADPQAPRFNAASQWVDTLTGFPAPVVGE